MNQQGFLTEQVEERAAIAYTATGTTALKRVPSMTLVRWVPAALHSARFSPRSTRATSCRRTAATHAPATARSRTVNTRVPRH